jgi:phage replication-related protein YjqB (UPF0714/DUF867 family)
VADAYQCFAELAGSEEEGVAWSREYIPRGSRILVMAPHGGWIEPMTCSLAQLVAGEEFSFYAFRGLGLPGTANLHLTSHRFDEPVALRAVAEAERVVAIHGEGTRGRPFVMIGGLWDRFCRELADALSSEDFPVEGPRPGLGGRNPRNICNRGSRGGGGQLEISEGFRRAIREDGREMERFVEAIRGVLLKLESDGSTPGGAGPGKNRNVARSREGRVP